MALRREGRESTRRGLHDPPPCAANDSVPPAADASTDDAAWRDVHRRLRRVWMSAPLRHRPHGLLAYSLRPARSHADDTAAMRQADDALATALSEAGPFFTLAGARMVVLPGRTAAATLRIAQAIRHTLDAGSAQRGVRIAAVVSILQRDTDPAACVVAMARGLRRAKQSVGPSSVIDAGDPRTLSRAGPTPPRSACRGEITRPCHAITTPSAGDSRPADLRPTRTRPTADGPMIRWSDAHRTNGDRSLSNRARSVQLEPG